MALTGFSERRLLLCVFVCTHANLIYSCTDIYFPFTVPYARRRVCVCIFLYVCMCISASNVGVRFFFHFIRSHLYWKSLFDWRSHTIHVIAADRTTESCCCCFMYECVLIHMVVCKLRTNLWRYTLLFFDVDDGGNDNVVVSGPEIRANFHKWQTDPNLYTIILFLFELCHAPIFIHIHVWLYFPYDLPLKECATMREASLMREWIGTEFLSSIHV